jgi:hypothetical protein
MRNRLLFKTAVILLVALLAAPSVTFAQELRIPQGSTNVESVLFQNDPPKRDSLWNGILIGAAIGVGVGMFILPYKICGSLDDSECSVIVRGAIGLPVIAGSIGVGALVDGLSSRDQRVPVAQRQIPSKTYGLQATVRF